MFRIDFEKEEIINGKAIWKQYSKYDFYDKEQAEWFYNRIAHMAGYRNIVRWY